MLDEALLRDYCEGFFGYGNPRGKYWFIGLEEGGGECEEVVRNRLALWHAHFNRAEFVDCRDFHCKLIECGGDSLCDLFADPPRRQHTWDKLIRVQIAIDQKGAITRREVQQFRLHGWGRKASENCLLELLPLPCPRRTKADWRYGDWTKCRTFRSREDYEEAIIPGRVTHLHDRIGKYKPKAVIFYSTAQSILPHWSAITGPNWQIVDSKYLHKNGPFKACFQCRSQTLFVVIEHPGYCRRNAYFEWVGEEIGKRLGRSSGS